MVHPALQAVKKLAEDNIDVAVADLHTVLPMDEKGLVSLLDKTQTVFVAEDHNTRSGVATAVADVMADWRVNGVRLIRVGFPSDQYALIGAPYHLYQHYGLTEQGLAAKIRAELGRK